MREPSVVGAEGFRGHAEKLADERVMIGEVFESVVVGVETEANDPKHKDLPEVEAGAAGDLFAREDFGFKQAEDFRLQRGVRPDPLQTGEDRRHFVAALERENDLLDRHEAEFGLGGEWLAHGTSECRGPEGRFPSERTSRAGNIRSPINTNKIIAHSKNPHSVSFPPDTM